MPLVTPRDSDSILKHPLVEIHPGLVRRLAPTLLEALNQVMVGLGAPGATCIALSGSTAKGEADRFSDLDLWCIVESPRQIEPIRDLVTRTVKRIGDPITFFAATHLAAEDLLIFFTELNGIVVKIDVEIVVLADFKRPPELTSLVDPDGIFSRIAIREPSKFDADEANRRVAGWLWYAYTKAARGELFEAVDALDTIRKLALVPLLLNRAGQVVEGYRRLESRLSPPTCNYCITRIHRCFRPTQFTKPSHLLAVLSATSTNRFRERMKRKARRRQSIES